MAGVTQNKSTFNQISNRIGKKSPRWVFTPGDFADLGTSQAVRHALSRLTQSGRICRLCQGIYYLPQTHPKLGPLYPSPDKVAQALQTRDGSRLQPTGAYAANLLGLSDQVPGKIVFYTDGTPRTVQIGNQKIILKKRSSRSMATAGKISGLVFQALEYLGRDAITTNTLAHLLSRLSQKDLKTLATDARYAPAWISDIVKELIPKDNSHERTRAILVGRLQRDGNVPFPK